MVERNGLFGTNEKCVHCEIDRKRAIEIDKERIRDKKVLNLSETESGKKSANQLVSPSFHGTSSTCSTESTISLTSSSVTPGIMRSASVNALCKALRAILAS